MIPITNKLLVESDPSQKLQYRINGIEVMAANKFNPNRRESSPVIAQAKTDFENVSVGEFLLIHHNSLFSDSPYKVGRNLFSVPNHGNIIFGKLDIRGDLSPLFGNLVVERLPIESEFSLVPSERQTYIDRYLVVDAGYTEFKKGQLIFTIPQAGYDIHYVFGGQLKVVTRVFSEYIVGRVK